MEEFSEQGLKTRNGIPVPEPAPDHGQKNLQKEAYEAGKSDGLSEGFRNGLQSGRFECRHTQEAEAAIQAKLAASEARRLFWDTAFSPYQDKSDNAGVDVNSLAKQAEQNTGAFISSVQKLDLNEFLEAEKAVNELYEAKQAEWQKNHKWWQVLDKMPESPMKVKRDGAGLVSSIDFPSQDISIPVTYWNSSSEAARLKALSDALRNANDTIERSLARKNLEDELGKLKLPQLAQLAARAKESPF